MPDQCCRSGRDRLLLQINFVCVLLALIGTTVIVRHPALFGGVPVAARLAAGR